MKRVNYNRKDLTRAFDDYKNDSISAAVAVNYGIPRNEVRNHKFNSIFTLGGGRPMLLSNQQKRYCDELDERSACEVVILALYFDSSRNKSSHLHTEHTLI